MIVQRQWCLVSHHNFSGPSACMATRRSLPRALVVHEVYKNGNCVANSHKDATQFSSCHIFAVRTARRHCRMMLMLSMSTSLSILVTRTLQPMLQASPLPVLLLRMLPIVSCILTVTHPTPLLASCQTVSSSTNPLSIRHLVLLT